MIETLRIYKPLLIITLISFSGSIALWLGTELIFMRGMMGFFLILIAIQKLFDVNGFTMNFRKYDLLAKRWNNYGRIYPFLEMALGLLFLTGRYILFTNTLLIILLVITTLGVAVTIRRGEALKCGCAGSAFSLPVGKVTIFENLVMMVMALYNLLPFLISTAPSY